MIQWNTQTNIQWKHCTYELVGKDNKMEKKYLKYIQIPIFKF